MRYHPLLSKVVSPQLQLWGQLENVELPFATTVLLGDLWGPGQQQTQTMAQLVFCPWGRLRAARAVLAETEWKGIPAGMPQIPPLLTLAKFSAFSKQFPHLRKTPHNHRNTRKPQLASMSRLKTTRCPLSPFALCH